MSSFFFLLWNLYSLMFCFSMDNFKYFTKKYFYQKVPLLSRKICFASQKQNKDILRQKKYPVSLWSFVYVTKAKGNKVNPSDKWKINRTEKHFTNKRCCWKFNKFFYICFGGNSIVTYLFINWFSDFFTLG